MVPPEWHHWLHCKTDGPLPTKPCVHKFTRANSKFNLRSTPKQYARILLLDRKVNKGAILSTSSVKMEGRPASAQTIHNAVGNYTFTADHFYRCLCFSSHCKLKLPPPLHLDPSGVHHLQNTLEIVFENSRARS